jgi:hypothetical protein
VSATAIQKLVGMPEAFSAAESISMSPVRERTVKTGVRSWKVTSGWSGAGSTSGERVNEREWEGWWFLKKANVRERMEASGVVGTRAVEWGVRMYSVDVGGMRERAASV